MNLCIWCRTTVFFTVSIIFLLSTLTNALEYDTILKCCSNYNSSEKCFGCFPDPCYLNPALTSPLTIFESRLSNLMWCSYVDVDCGDAAFSRYRTLDGSCNNIQNPSWGMSGICLRSILPHDYGDYKSYPRQSCLGIELPNSRVVSNEVHKADDNNPRYDTHTLMSMEWGQFVAHDISLNPDQDVKAEEACCKPNNFTNDVCISAEVPPDDPFFIGKRSCLPMIRSTPCPLCKHGQLESLNNATSYHDISLVYGSNLETSNSLRSFKHGMLKVQETPEGGILPPGINKIGGCTTTNSSYQCFAAGDRRINQNMMLTTLQVCFLRYHNHLCRRLRELNPCWDDEVLFQEARRICIAQAQMITYGHHNKHVLGDFLTKHFKLDVKPGCGRTRYDPSIDASTMDEFTSVALRYGHTMVPNKFVEIDPTTKHFDVIHLRDHYNYPDDFYKKPFVDRLAQGMGAIYGGEHGLPLGTDVRNFLYVTHNKKARGGGDLAATSVARGRDHGIPGYTSYLKYFFDYDVTSFCDLKRFMPMSSIRKFQKLYRSVHDIDLYSGGLGESHVTGGIVGPTFAAILIKQYRYFKFGDRYYFEHENESGSFTLEQLLEIKKSTLAGIICAVTKILVIQKDVFRRESPDNPVVHCKDIHQLDLTKWRVFSDW